jgi:hypothetical protein
VSEEPADRGRKPDAVDPSPSPKIHHDLEELISERPPDERAEVLVSLQEELTVPRLPDLPRGVSRRSPEGTRVGAAQLAVIEDLRARRLRSIETFLGRVAIPGLRLVRPFWLVHGFVADVRLGDVRALAAARDVRFLELKRSDVTMTPPSHDGAPDYPPHSDVAAGRTLIGTDRYYNLAGMTDGYIGLIDTGVDTHTLLFPPNDNLAITGDCVNGGWNCLQLGNPGFETTDCKDHGTSTAAILAGNLNLGNAFRGVTDIVVDSWRAYASLSQGGCTFATFAAEHSFEVGLMLADRVFAVEAQDKGGHEGILSQAADSAFDAGAVVVAANGNCAVSDDCNVRVGPRKPGSVRAPASARKVIGVGDFNVVNLTSQDYNGFGPTPDGRTKPDIQAPTDVKTADSSGFAALKERFGGTSGATPFAAGAAALMRNWLRKFNYFDPGLTYARIILSGTAIWTPLFGYKEDAGAGHLRLPEPCHLTAHWGKVTFPRPISGQTTVFNIPIQVAPGGDLVAAIWWPESIGQLHDDIDLYVLDPNGVQQAEARSAMSVWERTEVSGPLVPGTWTIRIKGASITSGPQTVYWTADIRKQCPREGPGGKRD